MSYDHHEIERRWQERWEADGLYRAEVDWDRPKHYALTMLPYTSGDLHIGHWYAMAPVDARARIMRMKGYNVLFPIGFDAFGLPAENAAIKEGIDPAEWTWSNIDRMRLQLRTMGAMFDWEREAISCDPSYYEWTEWFFNRFFEAGLAYRGEAIVNWAPALETVLANEQVIDGKDERTGTPVEQRKMAQWFFRLTDYADELLDFSGLDWPEPIRTMQTNWIGRSEGADVVFTTEAGDEIPVFTTRPDTLWGATFMVLAPEHDLVESLTSDAQRRAVEEYRTATARRSELERMETAREKTGVFTGGYATNPVNGERIPVWIADYVLLSYGSGAIMAVPAHDERDFEFARTMDLPVVPVIHPADSEPLDGETMTESYVGPGVMVNSAPIDGIETTDAKGRANPSIAATIDWLEENGIGTEAVNFKVRDWLISRQRYWGSPIPMVYKSNGTVEPDEDLPVVLPEGLPREGAASPLTTYAPFLDTIDSEGEPARRETDTQDTFVCSSWYQLRYLSPNDADAPFDPEEAAYWLPVDVYNGGAEHAVMHLMYTRFFTKAMRDLGLYDDAAVAMKAHGRDPEGLFDEPMLVLRNQGQILGEDSQRMSKSRGNVVNPDDLVDRYGADTVRTYLMFAFDWEKGGPWDPQGIAGARRFIDDVWKLGTADYDAHNVIDGSSEALLRAVHQTIEKVDHDMLAFKWNTAVAKLMELRNAMLANLKLGTVTAEAWEEAVTTFLLLLAPIAPHITEELWHLRENDGSIHLQKWPVANPEVAAEVTVTLVVQVNGKVRDRLEVSPDIDEDAATEAALAAERVQPYLAEGEVRKVIARPPGLVNVVVG